MIQTGIFSVVFCSLILLYTCYSDLKTRTVANEVWLLMIGVGIPLAIYNFSVQGIPFLIRFSLSLSVTFALSYLFFYLNLFGGADAKSLISIAVLIPVNPLSTSSIFDPLPFAVTALFNGAMVSLIIPPSLFLYYLLRLRSAGLQKDLGLAFIGYKIRIDTLAKSKHKFLRLLHSYESEEGAGEEGTVTKKLIFGGAEIDAEMIENLTNYRERGELDEDVWVTPGLPYMLFITAGFFIALFYGNVILHLLMSLFPL